MTDKKLMCLQSNSADEFMKSKNLVILTLVYREFFYSKSQRKTDENWKAVSPQYKFFFLSPGMSSKLTNTLELPLSYLKAFH